MGDAPGPEPPPRPRPRLLTEPRRSARVRDRPDAHWFAVAAVCVGAFMGQLDASIVTVALPSIQRTFQSGVSAVTWVGLSYLVTVVVLVVPVGRLSDTTGRKLVYTYGFVVFIAGSALCAVAPDLVALDLFRVVQAAGAAMLQANSVAIVFLAMPPDRLGRGIGVQGAAQALGLALGPTVGGLLIALGGWRLVFYVNVPFGLVGAGLGWLFIPRSRELAPRVRSAWADVVGPIWGLLRRPAFASGVASGLLSYLVLFGVLFVIPFQLERVRHLSTGRTGLVLTALPVALGVVAPAGGRLADRIGPRPVTAGGILVTGGALAVLVTVHSAPWTVVVILAVAGVGLGLFTPANNAAIMSAAPRAQSGLASGVLNMTRGTGTALGLALTSLIFDGAGFSAAVALLASAAALAAVPAFLRGRIRPGPGSAPPPL
jgi:MFS family permease